MYQTKVSPQITVSDPSPDIQPFPLWQSVVIFAIAALSILWFAGPGYRLFLSFGYAPLVSFLAAYTIPMALMFAAAFYVYQRVEGRPLTLSAFRERMRLPKLSLKDFGWGLAAWLVGGIGLIALNPVRLFLFDNAVFPLPDPLPMILNPYATFSVAELDVAAGGAIAGAWGIILLYAVQIFFNVVGEELWWRGIILPRQEAAHGRWAWLVHGLLWAGFHLFKWWDILAILPMALAIAYVSQRTRNTWPAIIAHTLGSISFFIILLLNVIG